MKVTSVLVMGVLIACMIGCDATKNDWSKAESERSIQTYEEFIVQHPDSELVEQAKSRIEELYFESAKTAATVEAYQHFLDLYPEGDFADSAFTGIEELHFEGARAKKSIAALVDFLQQYPDGKFASRAELAIKRLPYIAIVVDKQGKSTRVTNISAFYEAGGVWIGSRPNDNVRYLSIILKIKEGLVTTGESFRIPFWDIDSIVRTYKKPRPAIYRIEKRDGSDLPPINVTLLER